MVYNQGERVAKGYLRVSLRVVQWVANMTYVVCGVCSNPVIATFMLLSRQSKCLQQGRWDKPRIYLRSVSGLSELDPTGKRSGRRLQDLTVPELGEKNSCCHVSDRVACTRVK